MKLTIKCSSEINFSNKSYHTGSIPGIGRGGLLGGILKGSFVNGTEASGENGSWVTIGDFIFSVVWVPAAECVVLKKTGSTNSFLKVESTFL